MLPQDQLVMPRTASTEFKGVQGNRVQQELEASPEFLESQDSLTTRERLDAQDQLVHQSQDPRESEPPDLREM